jgi:hypothetical protein
MVKRGSWIAVGLIALAACLVDVDVAGPGYLCKSDADCGDFGPCIDSVCGGAGDAGHTDAGVDAGADAGGDAGADSGSDAGEDAGTDAGADAGQDAGADAGQDAGFDAGIDAGLPWWNPAYTSRMQLTISNTASSALPTGFTLGWPLAVESLLGGSGPLDQFRLVRWTGSVWSAELSRVIDANGTDAEWIWAPLAVPISAHGTDSSYWLYFGNAAPPASPNDPSTVFTTYEGFITNTLPGGWAQLGGVTFANSEAVIGTNMHLRFTNLYGPGYAVDFTLRQPSYAGRFWGGFQNPSSTFDDLNPWAIWIARNVSSPAQIWTEATEDGTVPPPMGTLSMPTTAHLFGVDRVSDRVLFRSDDVVRSTSIVTMPDMLNVRFTNESGATLYVQNTRVRQTVYPYPTVDAGPVEP